MQKLRNPHLHNTIEYLLTARHCAGAVDKWIESYDHSTQGSYIMVRKWKELDK